MNRTRLCVAVLAPILLLGAAAPAADAHTITPKRCVAYGALHSLITGQKIRPAYLRCRKAAAFHRLMHPLPNLPFAAVAISACESGGGVLGRYSYTAENPTSTASGRYQYLDSTWGRVSQAGRTWTHAADAPPRVQDERFVRDIADGTHPWAASQSCWSKWLAPF